MNHKRILAIGAGFSGAVIGRLCAEKGHRVTIIDKRFHIGGNAFDYTNEHGIRVHQYGPHLFHTKQKHVWDFLSRFTEWLPYQHKVKAQLKDGRYVTLPVNKETAEIVGKENVVETFIRPYSEKMWGMPLEKLDPSILARVPMRDDMNDLYFPNDPYQGMPKGGYTQMIERIIDHPNIEVKLEQPFTKSMLSYYDHVFNSMPIDEYYDFCFGELPYRSIKFHTADIPFKQVIPSTTVNFTHTGPYTRVTEWKNIPGHGENEYITTLTYEEPCDYRDNAMERYYPVKDIDGKNREVYLKYLNIENPNMTFVGRCGTYTYYDMDMAVSAAISVANKFLEK